MPIEYHQTMDPDIIARVRKRRHVAMMELKRLKFEEHAFFGEKVPAFGFSTMGCFGVLGMLVALVNEVSKVEGNLEVTLFHMVLVSPAESAYAAPFGLGVKFYTLFHDGSCLITADFQSPAIWDPESKLYKLASVQTIEAAWQNHKRQADRFCAAGRQKVEHLSLAGFQQLAQREDEYMLKHKYSLS